MAEHENDLAVEQAKILVEELLLRRHSNGQVVRLVRQTYGGMSRERVREMIKEIAAEWRELAEPIRAERRNQQRVTLHNLYARAFAEKNYGVCLGVENLLAKLDGTLAPTRVVNEHVPGKADEFEDKSEVELEYYALHGRWPEESKVH